MREASLKLACEFLEASLAEVEVVNQQQQAAAAAKQQQQQVKQEHTKLAAGGVNSVVAAGRSMRRGFSGIGGSGGCSPEAAAKQLQELLGGAVNFLFKAHQFVGGLNMPAQLLFGQLQDKVDQAWGASL